MQIIDSVLAFVAIPAVSISGIGLMFSSVASVLVLSMVHVGTANGKAYDEAVLTAAPARNNDNLTSDNYQQAA